MAMATQTRSGNGDHNVQIVLNAFNTLFNKRDYTAAEQYWSARYIQHSAHIPPGREGLFGMIKIMPETLRYENHLAAATGDDRQRCASQLRRPAAGPTIGPCAQLQLLFNSEWPEFDATKR
jgi:hypothetical protein